MIIYPHEDNTVNCFDNNLIFHHHFLYKFQKISKFETRINISFIKDPIIMFIQFICVNLHFESNHRLNGMKMSQLAHKCTNFLFLISATKTFRSPSEHIVSWIIHKNVGFFLLWKCWQWVLKNENHINMQETAWKGNSQYAIILKMLWHCCMLIHFCNCKLLIVVLRSGIIIVEMEVKMHSRTKWIRKF